MSADDNRERRCRDCRWCKPHPLEAGASICDRGPMPVRCDDGAPCSHWKPMWKPEAGRGSPRQESRSTTYGDEIALNAILMSKFHQTAGNPQETTDVRSEDRQR